jgi:hypothetical protein
MTVILDRLVDVEARRACRRSSTATVGVEGAALQTTLPFFDLPLRLFAGDAVVLLNPTHQLLALALDLVELVVGQLAPLLQGLAAELLPVAFDLIPVHGLPPVAAIIVSRSGKRFGTERVPSAWQPDAGRRRVRGRWWVGSGTSGS